MDVWSLGCILSENAIWVVHGYKGLQEYRRRRKLETDRSGFEGSYCFHNGSEVLDIVHEMHKNLGHDCHASDYISAGEDLYRMIISMLATQDSRPEARDLYHKAAQIIYQARTELHRIEFGQSSPYARAVPPMTPYGYHNSSSTPYHHNTSVLTLGPDSIANVGSQDDALQSRNPMLPTHHVARPHQHNPLILPSKSSLFENDNRVFDQCRDDTQMFRGCSPSTMISSKRRAPKEYQQEISRPIARQDWHPSLNIPSDYTLRTVGSPLDHASHDVANVNSACQARQPSHIINSEPDSTGVMAEETGVIIPVIPSASKLPNPSSLKIEEVRAWRTRRKRYGKHTGEHLRDGHHMQELKNRDHVSSLPNIFNLTDKMARFS